MMHSQKLVGESDMDYFNGEGSVEESLGGCGGGELSKHNPPADLSG